MEQMPEEGGQGEAEQAEQAGQPSSEASEALSEALAAQLDAAVLAEDASRDVIELPVSPEDPPSTSAGTSNAEVSSDSAASLAPQDTLVDADSSGAESMSPHDTPAGTSDPGVNDMDDILLAISSESPQRYVRAHLPRFALSRSCLAPAVPGVLVLLLAAIVLASLGVQHWGLVGMAAIGPQRTPTPRATATATATPTLAPTPAPTATPDPMIARNLAMGCAQGHPPSAPQVVFGTKDYLTGGAAPREVALTFDDGPTPQTSPPILDYLEQSHTPATFFVLGLYARSWPYLIQREWADGFAIGVHSWDHPPMTTVPDNQMAHQFGDTLTAIHAAIGANACIWFWRPPYGDFNGRVVSYAQQFGLTTIQWNADPADWSRPGSDVIVSRVLAQVRPGSIVVMHDGPARREQTAAALPQIVAGLRERGLTPVTIPQLLADSHYPGVATVPQYIPPNVNALPAGAISLGSTPTGPVPIVPDGGNSGE